MPGFISTPFVEVGGAAADLTHCQEMFWHAALVRVWVFTGSLLVLGFTKMHRVNRFSIEPFLCLGDNGRLKWQGSHKKIYHIQCITHTYMHMQ